MAVMKDVAVIGAGISGLAAGYLLSRRHRVHLFEREGRLGGHTHTVRVDTAEGPVALDTGFLVHNERTYPNLVRLFRELGIATRDSDMSFGVSCRQSGLEYSSRGVSGFFAQRRNLLRASHLRLLGEIARFNREAPALLASPDGVSVTLGEFLQGRRFGDEFVHQYLLPMASAIWSASRDAIRAFPAVTLVRFLDNHGLLRLTGQPTWKVVDGGSSSYVPKLIGPLADRVHPDTTIDRVWRRDDGVTITFADRPARTFDEVVFACHGDQVLPLLGDASPRERELFGHFQTTANSVWLHTDTSVLPTRPAARASWNYLLTDDRDEAPSVSYDLNRLQGLTTRERYCVTLNPQLPIAPDRVLRRMSYRHPLYTRAAIGAQARWAQVSGVNHTHYCGAYWGYGFHEDGLNSAIRVAGSLGVSW
jgi:predicted NAD/FAD-binding protein